MPIYTYRCENCGNEFDRQQSFEDAPLKVCPECRKHTLHKVYKATGVVFKGSGFYVTDKSKKSAAPTTNGKKPKDVATGSTTAETKSESKPETKSESSPKPKSEDSK
jgi:putative FmdB family regulatory protein